MPASRLDAAADDAESLEQLRLRADARGFFHAGPALIPAQEVRAPGARCCLRLWASRLQELSVWLGSAKDGQDAIGHRSAASHLANCLDIGQLLASPDRNRRARIRKLTPLMFADCAMHRVLQYPQVRHDDFMNWKEPQIVELDVRSCVFADPYQDWAGELIRKTGLPMQTLRLLRDSSSFLWLGFVTGRFRNGDTLAKFVIDSPAAMELGSQPTYSNLS